MGDPTVRAAREAWFEANGFSEAGYQDRWVRLRAGPISFYFPNTAARRRAVRLHDLHHLATGYQATWVGEVEIGAWELAAGCGRHYPAWILNAMAVALGAIIAPRRTVRAFLRGRRSRSLYDGEYHEALLDLTLHQLRARLRLA